MESLFKEFDVVKTIKELSKDIPIGTCGTIQMVFEDVEISYLIEFVDNEYDTIGLINAKEKEIELVVKFPL